MHEDNINNIKDEAIRLAKKRIKLLEETEKIFDSEQGKEITENISDYRNIIKNEIEKVGNLELTLAIVGTLKAGKSTLINAIVGYEILPNRGNAMTTIPTIITHKEGQEIPYMELKNIDLIKDTQEKLRKINRDVDNESEATLSIKEITDFDFTDRIEGSDKIKQALSIINDMLRICHKNSFDFGIEKFDENNLIPKIHVQFETLPQKNSNKIGNFSIVDTPGMNEANHREKLKGIFRHQIETASCVFFVMDYNQFESEATQEVKTDVQRILEIAKEKLFVIINRFDEQKDNTKNEQQSKQYVTDAIFNNEIDEKNVFTASAFYAFLYNTINKRLKKNEKPDINEKWIRDIVKKVYGDTDFAEDDYIKADISTLQERIRSFYSKSNFQIILDNAVEKLHENSHFVSIESILEKLSKHYSSSNSSVTEFYPENILKQKEESLKKDINSLGNLVKSLKYDIELIQKSKDDVNQNLEQTIIKVTQDIKAKCEEIFKKAGTKVNNIFNEFISKQKIEAERAQKKSKSKGKTNKENIILSMFSKNSDDHITHIEELEKEGIFKTEEDDVAKEIQKILDKLYSKLTKEIKNKIINILNTNLVSIEEGITDDITNASKEIQASIGQHLEEENFDIELDTLNLPKNSPYKIKSKTPKNIVTKEVHEAYWADDSGFFSPVARFFGGIFGTNWGQYYIEEKTEYTFDKKKILKSLSSQLEEAKKYILQNNQAFFEDEIKPSLDNYFKTFEEIIEDFKNILITTIHEKEQKDENEIKVLLKKNEDILKALGEQKKSIKLCNEQLKEYRNI